MFLNIIFKTMIPTQYASIVAVLAAVLVMIYSAAKTAWAAVNKKAEVRELVENHKTSASGLVGLCLDENGILVVCLGLVDDGHAIVYNQDDQEEKTYTVFASNLVKVD